MFVKQFEGINRRLQWGLKLWGALLETAGGILRGFDVGMLLMLQARAEGSGWVLAVAGGRKSFSAGSLGFIF